MAVLLILSTMVTLCGFIARLIPDCSSNPSYQGLDIVKSVVEGNAAGFPCTWSVMGSQKLCADLFQGLASLLRIQCKREFGQLVDHLVLAI